MAEQVDPQKPGTVQDYRKQPPENIELANRVKAIEAEVAALWKDVRDQPDTDKRMAAIARTEIETGFMWLVRSIFQPATDFDG